MFQIRLKPDFSETNQTHKRLLLNSGISSSKARTVKPFFRFHIRVFINLCWPISLLYAYSLSTKIIMWKRYLSSTQTCQHIMSLGRWPFGRLATHTNDSISRACISLSPFLLRRARWKRGGRGFEVNVQPHWELFKWDFSEKGHPTVELKYTTFFMNSSL